MLARTERMAALLSLVKVQRLQRHQVTTRVAVEWGLTVEKVHEYITLLISTGQLEISRVDGCLQLPGRQKSLKAKSC